MYVIAEILSKTLEKQGVINKEETDICRYGLELALLSVLEFTSILLIAIFARNFIHTMVFFVSFIPLRLYAGGYHANTRLRCYLILLAVYMLFTWIMNYTPILLYRPIEAGIVLLVLFAVWSLAPIIHRNKQVNDKECYTYRRISLLIMAVEIGMLLVGMALHIGEQYVFAFSLGQFAVAASMLAAFVKNKMRR